ncbi:hypothetical protein CIHG_03985 [Coccidioides immitis H538.4]|uniref:Nuclear RNA binding protein n=1 Tax=Coccidioides immitis H538.4 TaxID=396776 RepID=A0A0J8RN37_COCIT|nr:hypothetical protein CIHG_03985 [Coccidioides immitis H538.4]
MSTARESNDAHLYDAAWDSVCAAKQLKTSLRQSIGEDDIGLPRSSSKRKLSTADDDNESSISHSGLSLADSYFEDTDYTPIPDTETPPKRLRPNDWPLPNKNSVLAENRAVGNSTRPVLRSKRGQYLHDTRWPSAISPGRRSRFLEGSMRDRASVKPPPEFTGEIDEVSASCLADEETNHEYSPHKSFYQMRARTSAHLNSPPLPTENLNAKEPGIVRFGKRFASAFGIPSVLQNVSEIWKGTNDGNKPSSRDIAMDRKIRAERAYAKLKASGYPGTNKMVYTHTYERARTTSPVKSENKDNIPATDKDLPPPPVDFGCLAAPTIRPSRSCMSIAPSRKKASAESDSRGLPKRPSVKDLLRKEKLKERLTRRVSKLEEEWDKAQRELRALSSESEPSFPPAPVSSARARRVLQPTKLPSLPSERLLNNQKSPMKENNKAKPVIMVDVSKSSRRVASAGSTPRQNLRRSVATIAGKEENGKKRHSSTSSFSEYRCSQEIEEDKENVTILTGSKKPEESDSPPTRHQPPREAKTRKMGPKPGYVHTQNMSHVCLPASKPRDHGYSSRLRSKTSQDKAFTATPGENGVPPVPPLPGKLANSPKRGEFEWPEDCF